MTTYYEWVEEKVFRAGEDIDPDFQDPGQLKQFGWLVGDNEDTEEYNFRLGLVRIVGSFGYIDREMGLLYPSRWIPRVFQRLIRATGGKCTTEVTKGIPKKRRLD